jgi:hypothetical protein
MLHRSRISSGGRAAHDSAVNSHRGGYTTDSALITTTMQNTTATADDATSIQTAASVQPAAAPAVQSDPTTPFKKTSEVRL